MSLFKDLGIIAVNIDEEDSFQIAKSFSKTYDFSQIIHGYCETEEDQPTFGQIGCNGFILIKPNKEFLVESTPALL